MAAGYYHNEIPQENHGEFCSKTYLRAADRLSVALHDIGYFTDANPELTIEKFKVNKDWYFNVEFWGDKDIDSYFKPWEEDE